MLIDAGARVLELADGLSVTLPMQRAREQLRPLVSEADVRRVQEDAARGWRAQRGRLGEPSEAGAGETEGGDPLELAEVVRDSARRERMRRGKGTKSQLSPGEKGLYVKARQLPSREIGLARGLEPAEADAWIDEQLTPMGS